MKTHIYITAAALLSLVLAACSSEHSQPQLHSVVTVQPCPTALHITKTFTGRVQEAKEINLGFKTAGQIVKICVEEGDYVNEGDLIAQLDTKDYQLAVDALEVQYRQLTDEINRMKQLVDAKSLSANDYEKASAGWEQLGIQLQNSRNKLSYTTLTAPTSGYVQSVNYELFEMVDAGMAMITLLDTKRLKVEVDIPSEVYVQRERIGAIQCKTDAANGLMPMRLLSITPKADGNQLYRMKLAFADKGTPAHGLTAGMNVETVLTLAVADSAAMQPSFTLPLKAIANNDSGSYVWVVMPDSTVRKTAVTVNSIDNGGNAIVTSGLEGSEQVVKAGVEYLQDNEKVNILATHAETNVGNIL